MKWYLYIRIYILYLFSNIDRRISLWKNKISKLAFVLIYLLILETNLQEMILDLINDRIFTTYRMTSTKKLTYVALENTGRVRCCENLAFLG